ncbi:hypothetical protein FOZ62_013960, partial [Perkinsus olseni]
AWRFTLAQQHYHSNRRELTACCKSVQAAVDVIANLASLIVRRLAPAYPYGWVQGHGSISRSSLERRVVLRTLSALKDELDYLKTLGSGTIVIEHIEGKSNIMRDTLSRLFDREVPLQSGRKMKLVDALHGGSDNIADFPEIFPEPQSDTAGLSWIMRSEGAELDVNGVLNDFLYLRRVFNALRPSAKRIEDTQ